MVLLGWLLGVPILTQLIPGAPRARVTTAVTVALAGLGLLCTAGNSASRRRRRLGRICAGLVVSVGTVALCEYVFGWNLGIDNLLLPEPPGTPLPGHMAPPIAVSFLVIGVSILFLDVETPRAHRPAQMGAFVAAAPSFLMIVGYLYGVPALYPPQSPLCMAAPTAVVFLVLSAGILCARPQSRLMMVLTSSGGGGAVARRLILPALVVPVAFGWLRLTGERAGYYGVEFGLSLMVVLSASVLLALVWLAAGFGYRVDAASEEAALALERRVAERTAELAAANRELDAFSSSVSHDLRAPLRHLDAFAKLLAQRASGTADPKTGHYVAMIREAAAQMEEMIDGMLAFSRTAMEPLHADRVELAEVVKAVVDEMRADTAERTIEWEIGALPAVWADSKLLRHVLVNLLANAVKFTAPRPAAHIGITARAGDDGTVIVSVRDNGVGFDPVYADRLFTVFARLHRVEDFEGTGVGLATVRRIVERHGGRIWAEGEVDRGATFSFSLKSA